MMNLTMHLERIRYGILLVLFEKNGIWDILVPLADENALAKAIVDLLTNKNLRTKHP